MHNRERRVPTCESLQHRGYPPTRPSPRCLHPRSTTSTLDSVTKKQSNRPLTLCWDITTTGLGTGLLGVLCWWRRLLGGSRATEKHVGDSVTDDRSCYCSSHRRGGLCEESGRLAMGGTGMLGGVGLGRLSSRGVLSGLLRGGGGGTGGGASSGGSARLA